MNETVESPAPPSTNDMRETVLSALHDAQGGDVRVLDVRRMTDMTDYMIVVTGRSDRHVKTLSNRVLAFMQARGWHPIGIEGEKGNEWVLVDFVDVIVHVMQAATRKKYDLDSLWDPSFASLASPGEITV